MKLYEFQGKRIFKENGIPIQKGNLLTSAEQTNQIPPPAVLKAQILTGGRGKTGGIRMWDGSLEISKLIHDMFSKKIRGETVAAVLVLEKVEIIREIYLSITFEWEKATPMLIVSSEGGIEIEEIAKINSEKILTIPFDPFMGPTEYQIRYIAKTIYCKNFQELKNIIDAVYKIFKNYDAQLVEINPLVVTPKGMVALDSKIDLDEKSYYKHKQLFESLLKEQRALQGINKDFKPYKLDTISYIPLSGTIGLISDGAGTGMLTLDLIKDAGGEAANFCEMGGITDPEVIYKAMEIVLAKPGIKSLLVVLIGGFNRMDEMAAGIIKYRKEHDLKVPIFIRMCGTFEEVGKRIMNEAGIPTYDDLLEAVNKAVAVIKEE